MDHLLSSTKLHKKFSAVFTVGMKSFCLCEARLGGAGRGQYTLYRPGIYSYHHYQTHILNKSIDFTQSSLSCYMVFYLHVVP